MCGSIPAPLLSTHTFGCSELHFFHPGWKNLFLWIFFPFRLYSKEWCRLKSMCWGFRSWSRGFKALLIPSSPAGTRWQGWFSWWLPWAAVGMGRNCEKDSKMPNPRVGAMSLLGVFGALSPTSVFCWACVEGKSPSWQGNGDKWGRSSLIWGSMAAELAVITNFLSQLTQHFCQRSPGRAVCSRADLLLCAGSSSWSSLWLRSCGIYSWAFPDPALKGKCEWCLFIPGSLSLTWEACLCLKGWNPTSPLEKSYLAPSSFPFLRLFPLGASCQP